YAPAAAGGHAGCGAGTTRHRLEADLSSRKDGGECSDGRRVSVPTVRSSNAGGGERGELSGVAAAPLVAMDAGVGVAAGAAASSAYESCASAGGSRGDERVGAPAAGTPRAASVPVRLAGAGREAARPSGTVSAP